jgi:exoribonuclease R
MYLDREKLLSISGSKVDPEEIEAKVRFEVEQLNKQLQLVVNSLVTENMDMKRRIQKTEEKLIEIMKMLKESVKNSS